MIKHILFVLLICVSGASASDIYNVTNIISEIHPETVGGTNVITLHPHYVDEWFSLYNDGSVSYMIYAYDYVGLHDPPYKNAFIGTIEPGQMGVLTNNASYKIYADYMDIKDLQDVEIIEERFNQWWVIILIGIIFIIGGVKVLRIVWGR